MRKFDIVIIGGGAVGCAIAYQLSQYDFSIALLERNPDVAMGTSGKNSAVVHAGFNNRQGSIMAQLCVEGNIGFEELCQKMDVPYKKTGKLVIALEDSDLSAIDELLKNGEKNGCVGVSEVSRTEMDKLEPLVRGVAALYSANTAATDPFLYTIHLAEAALKNGVSVFLNCEVSSISRAGFAYEIFAGKDIFQADLIINSAGLYADKIAAMVGDTRYTVYPNRGEYLILDKCVSKFVSRSVYPAPRKGVGGLGVHLTATINGNTLIGPSAEYVDDEEQYATTCGMLERLFSEAETLLPNIRRNMIIGAYTGLRAKIVDKGEENFGDFIIEESTVAPGVINLIGIESPGLTASLPIAKYIVNMLKSKFNLVPKPDRNSNYIGPPRFRELRGEEQNALIKLNPNYGEIVCRCETVTKAEVLNALNNPLGARSIVAVKNRTRVMCGRCQGGYCLQRIAEIMVRELNHTPEEITYRHIADRPFAGWVK
jgi:glycerol-3-phosphate dehydrogenase